MGQAHGPKWAKNTPNGAQIEPKEENGFPTGTQLKGVPNWDPNGPQTKNGSQIGTQVGPKTNMGSKLGPKIQGHQQSKKI